MSLKLRFSVTCILYRRKLPDITQVLNEYVIHIKFLQNASFLRKLNPLNFALTYWIYHFLDHFNLWKSTLLNRTFSFQLGLIVIEFNWVLLIREEFNILRTQTFVSRLTGFQIWPSGRNTSILMNIINDILNLPKRGNKHDLIHFVTPGLMFNPHPRYCLLLTDLRGCFWC